MNLIFETVTVQNLRSFIAPQTLNIAALGAGAHFLRGRNDRFPRIGPNGTGKSSLINAISWGLYDRTLNGLRGPDLKPWSGATGNPRVELTLTIDNERQTIVKAPSNLTLNGRKISQNELEAKIPSFEVFRHAIAFGQGQPLFFDLTPAKKMELFSDTLNLERWERYASGASSNVAKLSLSITRLEGEIAGLDEALNRMDAMLQTAKTRSEEWEQQRAERVKESVAQREILNKQLDKVQLKRGDADLAYESASTELIALDREIERLEKEADVARDALTKVQSKLVADKRDLNRLTEELGAFGESDRCPICGQPTKGTDLEQHKKHLAQQIKTLRKLVEAGEPKKLLEQVAKMTEQRDRARVNARQFRGKADNARRTLDNTITEATELQTKIREIQRWENELSQDSNPFREQVQDLRRQIREGEQKLGRIDKELEAQNQKRERTRFWVKGFKDVRLGLIEDVLHEYELATNALLPESGLEDWQIRYEVEKETKSGTVQRGLNVTILSPDNKNWVKWEVWSGGESQRLRIVGALALSEVLLNHAGVACNLEILDEPTQHMTTEGIKDLCEFLASRARQLNKVCLYVDHNAVESSYFASVITVARGKHGSYIET